MQIISNKHRIFINLLLLHGVVFAQNKNPEETTSKIIVCESTLAYPQVAQENNISGTVIVAFDIDSNCRMVNIRIEKGIGYGCDEEAINSLKKCSPKFIGARPRCTPIFNLKQPFTFRKSDDD